MPKCGKIDLQVSIKRYNQYQVENIKALQHPIDVQFSKILFSVMKSPSEFGTHEQT